MWWRTHTCMTMKHTHTHIQLLPLPSPPYLFPPAVSSGLRVVDGPDGGTCRELPGLLRCGHGRRPGDPITRELGQLPSLPASQRLPAFRLWAPESVPSSSLVFFPAVTWISILLSRSSALSAVHLCNGKFHKHLQDLYAPLVVRYVDLMESSIAQSIHKGFDRESWEPVK